MSPKARPRAKAALDLGSRVQRQEQRASLGPLESLRLEPSTRKRYVQAYARFALFVTCMTLQILSYEALDEAVAMYIEELRQAGDPKLWCNDILSALHFYTPTCKRRLPMGWALHKAWGKNEMPSRACPMGVDLLLGLCGAWVRSGAARVALVVFCAYRLLLRTREMFGLTCKDLQVGNGGVQVVSLGKTKTSQRDGLESAVTVLDAAVALVLAHLRKGLAPGDRLLQVTQGAWRKSFTQTLSALQIDHLHVRGYSIRRGGATFQIRMDGHFDATMERGRWHSLSTTRKYLEDAAAAIASLQVPEWSKEQMAILADEFVQYVRNIVGAKAVQQSVLLSAKVRADRHVAEPPTPKKRKAALPKFEAPKAGTPPSDAALRESLRGICFS